VKVRVACRGCGDLPIGLADVVLRLCEDDLSAAYRFRCPRCGLVQLEDAGLAAAAALLDADVDTEWWCLPDRSAEHPSGQPITAEDVSAAALVLEDEQALAAALATLTTA
jgi:hypothetical protein